MKYINLTVEFKDPKNELKNQLQKQGAKNIDVKRNYNGDLEVRYVIKAANPEKEIESLLSSLGGTSIRSTCNSNGGRFDLRLNDNMDERSFKQIVTESLRRSGYRVR